MSEPATTQTVDPRTKRSRFSAEEMLFDVESFLLGARTKVNRLRRQFASSVPLQLRDELAELDRSLLQYVNCYCSTTEIVLLTNKD